MPWRRDLGPGDSQVLPKARTGCVGASGPLRSAVSGRGPRGLLRRRRPRRALGHGLTTLGGESAILVGASVVQFGDFLRA